MPSPTEEVPPTSESHAHPTPETRPARSSNTPVSPAFVAPSTSSRILSPTCIASSGSTACFSRAISKIFGAGLAALARLCNRHGIEEPVDSEPPHHRKEPGIEVGHDSPARIPLHAAWSARHGFQETMPRSEDLQTPERPARRIHQTARTSRRDKTRCARCRTTRAVSHCFNLIGSVAAKTGGDASRKAR